MGPSYERDAVDRIESSPQNIDPPANRYSAFHATQPLASRRREQEVIIRHPERRAVIGASRISSTTLANVMDNSDRRQYGMGIIGRFFG